MLGIVCFIMGFMLDGGVAVIGLSAMDSVPDHLSGSAHGMAAAFGQGMSTRLLQSCHKYLVTTSHNSSW